jgi:signal-transduction protein with cAMP-binding, CBS, and nucleotidyltransferase domain
MCISIRTGRDSSEHGSINQPERPEDKRKERLKLQESSQDLSRTWDPLLEVRLENTTKNLNTEEDSPYKKLRKLA